MKDARLFTSTVVYVFLLTVICVLIVNAETGDDLCSKCHDNCDNSTGVCHGDCYYRYYGDKCDKNCSSDCLLGCHKNGTCKECFLGTYGDRCEHKCPEGCFSQCDRKTGACIRYCKDNRFGEYCNKTCPSSPNCYLDKCNLKDGHCTYGCKKGLAGDNCTEPCPVNCKPDLGCDKITRECTGSCPPGIVGDFCEKTCVDPNCDKCTIDKDGNTKECWFCKRGWHGEHCELNCSEHCEYGSCSQKDGTCLPCSEGWFGKKCTQQCYTNCARCIDTSTCSRCMVGWYGQRCEKRCQNDCASCSRSGDFCYSCANVIGNGNCQCYGPATDGQCIDDKNGFCFECRSNTLFVDRNRCCPCSSSHCLGGTNTCGPSNISCDACEVGYYGKACTEICSSHCKDMNGACDKDTGRCLHGCEDGWVGLRCNDHCETFHPHCTNCTVNNKTKAIECSDCEPGYYLPRINHYQLCDKCVNCKNDRCNMTTGACLDGCQDGWHVDRYYGLCSKSCDGCFGNQCYDNGTCKNGCKAGKYGQTCSLDCPKKCLNNSCSDESGYCDLGCDPGYYGNMCFYTCSHCKGEVCFNHTTGECEECKPQSYGPFCRQSCKGCIDGLCVNGQGCQNGCKHGLYGQYCNISCGSSCLACVQETGKCLICNKKTSAGQDNSGCIMMDQSDWLSSFVTNSSCANGKYGPSCADDCPESCNHRNGVPVCDKYTGACLLGGCAQGHYGAFCNLTCSSGCNTSSVDGNHCEKYTGHCTEGCNTGLYGELCNKNCSVHCVQSSCNRSSGACEHGCLSGWTSDDCSEVLELTRDEDEETGIATTTLLLVILIPTVVVVVLLGIVIKVCCQRQTPQNNRDKYSFQDLSKNSAK